jgi:hypothetical protein
MTEMTTSPESSKNTPVTGMSNWTFFVLALILCLWKLKLILYPEDGWRWAEGLLCLFPGCVQDRVLNLLPLPLAVVDWGRCGLVKFTQMESRRKQCNLLENFQQGNAVWDGIMVGLLQLHLDWKCTRYQWLRPVILATQEAEIRRIPVRSQPGKIGETLPWKKTLQTQKKGW